MIRNTPFDKAERVGHQFSILSQLVAAPRSLPRYVVLIVGSVVVIARLQDSTTSMRLKDYSGLPQATRDLLFRFRSPFRRKVLAWQFHGVVPASEVLQIGQPRLAAI